MRRPTAGCAARGILVVALAARRTCASPTASRWSRTGCPRASACTSVQPERDVDADGAEDVADEIDRERMWHDAPIVLETNGVSKRFGGIVAADDLAHRAAQGHDHRPRRPERRRQDDGVQPAHRRHPSRRRLGEAERRRAGRAQPGQGGAQGLGALVPGRAAVQPAVVPPERDDGGAAPGGRELRHAAVRRTGVSSRVEAETREKAMDWLGFVGMAEFADVPAGALSYGQTKLVSLARVLATEADVLLLDEPASGIDTKWVDTMLDLIEAVREQGRTVCVVEHNLHVVGRLADHTYFMELGEITAQGTIDELTNTPRLAEAYFGTCLRPSTHRSVRTADRRSRARRREAASRLRPQAGRVRRRPHGPARARSSACSATTAAARARRSAPSSASSRSSAAGSSSRVKDVTRSRSRANVKAGMAMIPSERFVFADLTVIDNLLLGGANDPDAGSPGAAAGARATSCSRSWSSAPASWPGRCPAASSGWSASAWR